MIRTRKVELPEDDLILLSNFTLAIAQAIWPSENLKGIECIAGLIDTKSGNISALTGKNRVKMERLLEELPALECSQSTPEITEEQKSRFLEAYRKHPNKLSDFRSPDIEPRLVDLVDIKSEQFKKAKGHFDSICEKYKQGKIGLVNGNHIPVQTPSFDTYITRKEALNYLKECRLSEKESNDIRENPDKGNIAVKGAAARRKQYDPLREYVRKLAKELKPKNGWKSRAEAARVIDKTIINDETVVGDIKNIINDKKFADEKSKIRAIEKILGENRSINPLIISIREKLGTNQESKMKILIEIIGEPRKKLSNNQAIKTIEGWLKEMPDAKDLFPARRRNLSQ